MTVNTNKVTSYSVKEVTREDNLVYIIGNTDGVVDYDEDIIDLKPKTSINLLYGVLDCEQAKLLDTMYNLSDDNAKGGKVGITATVISTGKRKKVLRRTYLFSKQIGTLTGLLENTQGVIITVTNDTDSTMRIKTEYPVSINVPSYYKHYEGVLNYNNVASEDTIFVMGGTETLDTVKLIDSVTPKKFLTYEGQDAELLEDGKLVVQGESSVIILGDGVRDTLGSSKSYTHLKTKGLNAGYVVYKVLDYIRGSETAPLDGSFEQGHIAVDCTEYPTTNWSHSMYTTETSEIEESITIDTGGTYQWGLVLNNESVHPLTLEIPGGFKEVTESTVPDSLFYKALVPFTDDDGLKADKKLLEVSKLRDGLEQGLLGKRQHYTANRYTKYKDTEITRVVENLEGVRSLIDLPDVFSKDDFLKEYFKLYAIKDISLDWYTVSGKSLYIKQLDDNQTYLLNGGGLHGVLLYKDANLLYVKLLDLSTPEQKGCTVNEWSKVYALDMTKTGVKTYKQLRDVLRKYTENFHIDECNNTEKFTKNRTIILL